MTRQTKGKRNKQKKRKEKGKERAAYPLIPSRESQRKLHSRRARPAFFPCVTRASLPVQTLLSLLRKLSSGVDAPYPRTPQETQNCLRGLLPKPLARGRFAAFRIKSGVATLPPRLPTEPALLFSAPRIRKRRCGVISTAAENSHEATAAQSTGRYHGSGEVEWEQMTFHGME